MNPTCRGDTTLILGVDEDDLALGQYQAFSECEIVILDGLERPARGLAEHPRRPSCNEFKAIGHIGDDNVPRTVGWDVRIMESLTGTVFCFGDDLDPGQEPRGPEYPRVHALRA